MSYLTIKNVNNLSNTVYSTENGEWYLHRIIHNHDYYEFEFYHRTSRKYTSFKLYRRANHYDEKNFYRLSDGARFVSADWFTIENATISFKEILESRI